MKNDIILSDEKSTKKFSVLRGYVMQALQEYFTHLDGLMPTNLYALAIKEFEVPILEMVLNYVDGNQSKAAQVLGLSRGTLHKKLRHYKLVKRFSKAQVKHRSK